jgi:hypothetical protein
MSEKMFAKEDSGFAHNKKMVLTVNDPSSTSPRLTLTQELSGAIELTKEDAMELSAALMAFMLICATVDAVKGVDAKFTAEEVMKKMRGDIK